MAITYISSTDPFVGYGHPFYPNILFRAGAYIKTQLEVEHNDDGTHPNKEHGLLIEEGTYTGNGLARTISLSASNLDSLWIGIYADNASYFGANIFYANDTIFGYHTDNLTAIATGSFSIAAADTINHNGTTFYYVVLGYDNTTAWSGTASGSDPTWISDGDTLDADVAGTGALNQVAKHIEDVFLDEHNDSGTHKTSPFSFFIEVETFTPNGLDDRTITLDENIDIKGIWMLQTGNYRVHKNESLSGDAVARTTTAGCALTNYIQSIGTGSFQVGTNCNSGTAAIYYCVVGE